jgi:Glycosyl transferase family 2
VSPASGQLPEAPKEMPLKKLSSATPKYDVVLDQRVEADLSVVIPAFNTGSALSELLVCIDRAALNSGISADLIVVDDGSTDGSTNTLPPLTCLSLLRGANQGKGSAVLAGMRFSKGKVCAFVDGDGAYDEEALFSVCRPVLLGRAMLSVGQRAVPPHSFSRTYMSKVFSFLVRRWYGFEFDTQAGVKAFHRDVLDAVLPTLAVKGFSFDVKLLACSREQGYWPAALVVVRPRATKTSTVTLKRSTSALLDLYRDRVN